ncbi:hypothetical protein AVEN_18814-1 [Araneus ventricosus]|uniref:Uncharacterized protein n=1 Tax=Araneus ventricosus TaxID=182803 RepID=A0A4Y2GHK4_ARAVE|nr:hypothetical protein AVEN_18814-1 [Araneus ventricosus]
MEKSDRSEPEETVQEGLNVVQDPAVDQIQEVDLDGLQSDKQLQKSGDPTQNEAFKLVVTDEAQKLLQQEKEEPAQNIPNRDSLQKSEKKKSFRQEYRELEELGQKTDANIMVQEKDESSFALEEDSRQANQSESDAIHQKRDVFSKDKLLESDGNATVKRTAEAPERILLVPDQESIQITQQEDNDATQQECDRIVKDESLQPKFKTNLTEQLKEETRESSIASMEDPTRTAEQEANDGDRTTENDRHFQESESGPESEESHHVCLRTGQLEEVAFLPSPSRICHHRTHIVQRQRLPLVPEVPDDPLAPFEEEILIGRHSRTLGERLPTLKPTGNLGRS